MNYMLYNFKKEKITLISVLLKWPEKGGGEGGEVNLFMPLGLLVRSFCQAPNLFMLKISRTLEDIVLVPNHLNMTSPTDLVQTEGGQIVSNDWVNR